MMDPSLLLFFGEGTAGGSVLGGGRAGAAADHYLDFLSQLRYGGTVAQPSVLVVDDGDSESDGEDAPLEEDTYGGTISNFFDGGGDDAPLKEDPYGVTISNFFDGGDDSADPGEDSAHDCGCGDIREGGEFATFFED